MPAPTITIKQLQAQPILFIQRRVPATQLQPLFAECFGKLYMHGHQAGLAIAGHPMARYVAIGAGLWTVDSIMPLLAPATSEGEMQAGYLADGEVVLAVHTGPYERLPESYVAIEHWMEANNLQSAGPHWESYVTDPGEVPDPEQWKTEIFWPIVRKVK